MISPPQTSTRHRWIVPGVCILLALLVFAVYAQTVSFGFCNYDDNTTVYDTPQVAKGLSFQGAAWAFTHTQVGNWFPLTTLSHMADCQFYGLRAGPHHLTNATLHALAAILLFLLLRKMTGTLWRAALVSALWAVHPQRVESVAWITERKDVLGAVFMMLTLLAYVWYTRKTESKGRLAAVAGLFTLGLLSKSMLVTLPFVMLLLDYWPLQRLALEEGWLRHARRLFLEKLPLLLLSLIICVVQMKVNQDATVSFETVPLSQRMENTLVTCAVYLRQMVWPVHLALYYPHPRNTLEFWNVAGSALILCSITAAAVAGRKKQPWLLVGWLWYLGMLVPVIGLVQTGGLARADRYTYLPQMGIWIAIAWCAAEWAGTIPWRRMLSGGSAAMTLIALLAASHKQTACWRDNVTLWTHTLECTRENCVTQTCLANALLSQGETGKAIFHCRKALECNRAYPAAHINLAKALLKEGRKNEAIAELREALNLSPGRADYYFILAWALINNRQQKESIDLFEKGLAISPNDARAHNILGGALVECGRTDDAIGHLRKALELEPDLHEAAFNLGKALAEKGEIRAALDQYHKVTEAIPGSPEAWNNLAWLLSTAHDPTLRDGAKALACAQKACELGEWKDATSFDTLAAAYAEKGEFEKAIEWEQKYLKAVPSDDDAVARLALYRKRQPCHQPAK